MAELKHIENKLSGLEGQPLFYQAWLPDEIKRILVVAHGLGEHGGRYSNLVDYFAPLGYAIYALDHRGHGRSGGQRGHVKQFSYYMDDLRIFVQLVKEAQPGKEIFLVGHSLGGLIALIYGLEYPSTLKGVIVSSPGLAIKVKVPFIKEVMGKLLSTVIPRLAMSNGIPPEHICRDETVVEKYKADALVHDRVTTRWFTEFIAAQAYAIENAKNFSLPVLLMLAGNDELSDPEGSKLFYHNLSIEDRELKIYDGLYHELFNEMENQKVFEDMENWLDRH